MPARSILLFCWCLLLLPSNQLTGATDPLTNEQFEKVFTEYHSMKAFHSNPSYSYLFTQSNGWLTSSLVAIPQCLVVLIEEGEGQIGSECARILKGLKKKDKSLSTVFLAYRCLKSDNPYDYDLYTAKVEAVRRKLYGTQEAAIIHFTYKSSTECSAAYSAAGSSPRVDYLPESDMKATEIENTYSLIKEMYELSELALPTSGQSTDFGFLKQSYQSPITYTVSREQFDELIDGNHYLKSRHFNSFLFAPNYEKKDGSMAPVCSVILHRHGKGSIHEQCGKILKTYTMGLKVLQQFDPNFSESNSLKLAYRCYLFENPEEYELHTVNVDGIGIEKGIDFVYFKTKESTRCRPIWKELHSKGVDEMLVYHDEL